MHSRRRDNRYIVLFVVLCAPSLSSGQDNEETFVASLRSRRLFALAEKYCEDELAEEKQSARRTTLVGQLSRTLVEHAKYLPPKQRDAMWKQADQVLFEGSGKIPEPDFKTRLEAQGALNLAHQGTFLRWQAQVTPQDTLLKELALFRIGKATKALESAVDRVRNNFSGSSFERTSLRNTLELYQAQAIMDQARLETVQSADRISLAAKAEAIARQLSSTAVNRQTKLQARVLSAECARERGDGRRSVSMLESAMELADSDADRDRIVAERIRSLLYNQQPDKATKEVIAYRQERGSLTGELHLLRMRSLIELWNVARAAKNEKLGDALIQQMETGATYAQLEVAGYWSVRCSQLLNATREKNTLGSALAKLKLKAEQDFSAGRTTAAASNFGLAAEEAVRKEKFEVAAQLFYQQGSILIQDEQFRQAAIAYKQSASAGEIEESSTAHLMFAWCLGRIYRSRATKPNREAYRTALNEHRALHKSGTTFAEATFMLAALEETRLQNTKAIELYKQIRVLHQPRYTQASAAIARCYSKVLKRLQTMKKSQLVIEWQSKAEQDITPRLTELPLESDKIDLNQAELAIRGAAILLQGNKPNYAQASRLIEWGVGGTASVEPSKRTAALIAVAEQWRLMAALASGNTAAATSWINNLNQRSGPELMSLVDSLDDAQRQNSGASPRMAQIRLKVGQAATAKASELEAADRERLSAWMVGVYLNVGQRDAAQVQARKLIEASSSPQLLSRTSAHIQTLKTKEAQTLARQGWKRLESVSTAGSPIWLNARLNVIRCSVQLGETQSARKLLRVTKLLYPDLDGRLKSQFEQLELTLP